MNALAARLSDGQQVTFWTAEAVMERIEEAADTLRKLPGGVDAGVYSGWPDIVRGFWEVWNSLDEEGRKAMERERHEARGRPTSHKIDEMDEALSWLLWVDPRKRRVLWASAIGIGTGKLGRQMRVNRETIRRWKRQGLHQIVGRLNG